MFKDRLQTAEKNDWMEEHSWLTKTDVTFDVHFGKKKVVSRLYDIDVAGYDSGVNKLRLFDIESIDESIVEDGITFDKEEIEKNLTCFCILTTLTRQGTCCGSTSSILWCAMPPSLSSGK